MISMAYAPESGSEQTRRLVKKQMKTDRLMNSIRAARDADLNVACFLIIGLPHDSSESIAENLDFIDQIVDAGVDDIGINFYMALPGTELFNSLQDAGHIELNRAYFRHILDALALWPSKVYCKSMTKARLTYWKFRLFFRFYGSKNRGQRESGLVGAIAHALKGLIMKKHSSKLQTAIRYAFKNATDELKVRFKRRWMSRRDERILFEDWPEISRRIRNMKLSEGVAVPVPEDTSKIHEKNVVFSLRPEHGTQRAFTLEEMGVASDSNSASV